MKKLKIFPIDSPSSGFGENEKNHQEIQVLHVIRLFSQRNYYITSKLVGGFNPSEKY